ncbi:hypothetical protein B0J12DRAFT_766323 [Macrophomina phaseolina]|uniref:ferric-chelate reductase (NADPH) n=1 Tax=Macrophomina phaseolina TaxID=35725 RepID=A0ABQ8FY13_9PEZI|nr:hypothetical protein B0J12DRAFT_766323 [Macrophomina phaseolina]
MNVLAIYSIFFGVLLGTLALRRLYEIISACAHRYFEPLVRKWVFNTILLRRQSGSSDISICTALLITVYLTANAFATFLHSAGGPDINRRLGMLCLINLVPLYVGGRTSYVIDHALGMSLDRYLLLHRWIGRVCLLYAAGHGISHSVRDAGNLSGMNIAVSFNYSRSSALTKFIKLLSLSTSMALVSFLYIRRRFYEAFLFTHACSGPALLALLWFHTTRRGTPLICLTIASSLWLLQKLTWLVLLFYRNHGFRAGHQAWIIPLQRGLGTAAVRLDIEVLKPWAVQPGQYVYITIPGVDHRRLGFLQAHPYIISWAANDGQKGYITIILEGAHGFSQGIIDSRKDNVQVMLDGPYGKQASLHAFDKVLFVACGIGVTAHLLQIRQLLEAHNQSTARVRRITLIWFLYTRSEKLWVDDFFDELLDMDHRHVLNIIRYMPQASSSSSDHEKREVTTSVEKKHNNVYDVTVPLELSFILQKEWMADAGNMALNGELRLSWLSLTDIQDSMRSSEL